MKDIQKIARECTKSLSMHGYRSPKERLLAVAESPLALERGDHYGRGGVVAELEAQMAELLGKEAAVFMPSGTMAQPIALRIWSDEAEVPRVAFHPTCHLELHEHHAYRELHQLEAVLLGEVDRLFTLEDLLKLDQPISTLLIELPQREIGGQLPSWDSLCRICLAAKAEGIRTHLDGARLWECQPFYNRSYAEIADLFDSVYVSYYKVLDGLPGAILAGPSDFIAKARIWQRRQGGNLYQMTSNAISAKLGMEKHLPRIPDYVAKASEVAEVLRSFETIRVVPKYPPTNMMHLYIAGDPERLLEASLQVAEEDGIGLFFHLSDQGKVEISVGEAALDLGKEELHLAISKLLSISHS